MGGMRRGARWAVVLAVLSAATVVALPQPASSSSAATCRVWRTITRSTGDVRGEASALGQLAPGGRHVIFTSKRNLTGQNRDQSDEVFLHDVRTRQTRQVTRSDVYTNLGGTTISGSGSRYVHGRSYGNGLGGSPVQRYDTNRPRPVWVVKGGRNGSMQLSADGTHLVLWTTAHLDVDRDGSDASVWGESEVWLVDVATREATQVSHNEESLLEWGGRLSISADGSVLAFESGYDLTGENSEHDREVFLYDAGTDALDQVTDGGVPATDSRMPALSGDGSTLVYAEPAGTLTRYDVATGATTPLTTAGISTWPSVSRNGNRIAHLSTADPNGTNPEANTELFVADVTAGLTHQVTSTTGRNAVSAPSISADGTRVAFGSRASLGGRNPDRNPELFLALCG